MRVLAAVFCLAVLSAAGCGSARPPVVVVASEDLGLVRMEWNGVPGWWAPQATMVELMQARRERQVQP